MRKFTTFILFILLIFKFADCLAQEKLTVSKPKLEIQGENLSIAYDILNSKPGEKYSISLEVTDSKGILINAQSFKGDVGDNVEGGTNKKIIWNFTSDNVRDEVNIYIKIVITKHNVLPGFKEIAEPKLPYTRGGLLLKSIILPGLGLSKLNDDKPYWIMGVAGYGLIAGSIIFNESSKSNYRKFLNSGYSHDENLYYKKFQNQYKISVICAIGAATIWVADLIWVVGSSSKAKDLSYSDKKNRLLLVPDYKVAYKAPVLTLKYTF